MNWFLLTSKYVSSCFRFPLSSSLLTYLGAKHAELIWILDFIIGGSALTFFKLLCGYHLKMKFLHLCICIKVKNMNMGFIARTKSFSKGGWVVIVDCFWYFIRITVTSFFQELPPCVSVGLTFLIYYYYYLFLVLAGFEIYLLQFLGTSLQCKTNKQMKNIWNDNYNFLETCQQLWIISLYFIFLQNFKKKHKY